MSIGTPQISASLLNADFARLGDEAVRALDAGCDSLHFDVMDGHFVEAITMGPNAIRSLRPYGSVPYHAHLMVSRPLSQVTAFAEAGSDLIAFHVEADDDPGAVIDAIHAAGRGAGLTLNPETAADAVLPFLDRIELLLVMTVHPGRGGQELIHDVLPRMAFLRDQIDRRGVDLPIGVDGGVNLGTIGAAHAAGGEVFVAGSVLYREQGDLAPVVAALRAAALEDAE
ncbi:MAG: ribulose-phosphate 3-epimerase [Chloroflexota bacterium]|nr:ribulose-phosphate 3-epimerase [Chloroflexota bacterium]